LVKNIYAEPVARSATRRWSRLHGGPLRLRRRGPRQARYHLRS